ncbi:hypothetical protein N7523_009058 [Penicillium sp. IBT 18751x]|nr:hypothetical protein N7523_009058 [Penicillium sp. IBT 18751x]
MTISPMSFNRCPGTSSLFESIDDSMRMESQAAATGPIATAPHCAPYLVECIGGGFTYINGKPVARFEKGCTDWEEESDRWFP